MDLLRAEANDVCRGGRWGSGAEKMPPLPPHVGMITGSGAKLRGTSGFLDGGGGGSHSQRLLCRRATQQKPHPGQVTQI